MRGGVNWSWLWLERPDRHAIVTGTVDQIGSRLLFRGYGVGQRLWPVDAALAGADSLIIVDEAHLSDAFLSPSATSPGLDRRHRPRPVVVAMSASPGEPRRGAHRISSADERHPVAGQRLRAPKGSPGHRPGGQRRCPRRGRRRAGLLGPAARRARAGNRGGGQHRCHGPRGVQPAPGRTDLSRRGASCSPAGSGRWTASICCTSGIRASGPGPTATATAAVRGGHPDHRGRRGHRPGRAGHRIGRAARADPAPGPRQPARGPRRGRSRRRARRRARGQCVRRSQPADLAVARRSRRSAAAPRRDARWPTSAPASTRHRPLCAAGCAHAGRPNCEAMRGPARTRRWSQRSRWTWARTPPSRTPTSRWPLPARHRRERADRLGRVARGPRGDDPQQWRRSPERLPPSADEAIELPVSGSPALAGQACAVSRPAAPGTAPRPTRRKRKRSAIPRHKPQPSPRPRQLARRPAGVALRRAGGRRAGHGETRSGPATCSSSRRSGAAATVTGGTPLPLSRWSTSVTWLAAVTADPPLSVLARRSPRRSRRPYRP